MLRRQHRLPGGSEVLGRIDDDRETVSPLSAPAILAFLKDGTRGLSRHRVFLSESIIGPVSVV
ncbi:hypothetical protein [uncultured Jannaschia sp.]|uniref:hypothetical protein n=1 Tax=uncultured Jannaschia sp. TaxID=293347 RepID=UPI00261F6269|nr:hypothetical protein [uncultured Jannaschia sp.]